VKKIDFLNNVKFQMRDKLILGDKAEYTKNDNTLKIIDNVIYKGDNSEINGDIFTYNLKTKVSKLSSKKKFNNKIKGRIKAKFKINKNVGS
jgi:lipopolysaccharide assembly outer membrane protein LptD (OstA)